MTICTPAGAPMENRKPSVLLCGSMRRVAPSSCGELSNACHYFNCTAEHEKNDRYVALELINVTGRRTESIACTAAPLLERVPERTAEA